MGRATETFLSFALAVHLAGCQWSGVACFGDCDDWRDRHCSNPEHYGVSESAATMVIDPSGADYTIDVTGSGSLIRVMGHGVPCEIRVEGHNNLLHFETAPQAARVCRITGNDNTIERPSGSTLNCEDDGVGNTVLVY